MKVVGTEIMRPYNMRPLQGPSYILRIGTNSISEAPRYNVQGA